MKKNVIIVLCLVYASLVSAGFFTPSSEKQRSKDDVRVDKEGVVIGVRDDNGNTKVKISPREVDPDRDDDENGVFASAKEKIKEVIPEVLKKEEEIHHKYGPGEAVREGINTYMGRTKGAAEKVANEAEEAVVKSYTAEEKAKEAVKAGFGKVKDKAAQATQKAREMKEKAANEAVEKGYTAEEEAKEAVEKRTGKVKDKVAQATHKASDKWKESVEEAASEVSGKVREKGKAAQERVKTQGKEGLKRVFAMVSFSGVLHLLGFATAYGMCVWVTFGSNYVLARALPRQQLAMVQSRVYPVYFKAMASSVGLALLGYIMDRRRSLLSFGVGIFLGFDLLASLFMILVNLLYLEPLATKVLFERMRKEKEEGGGDANVPAEGKKGEDETAAAGKVQNVRNVLGRLNSYSSLLNVATLMSLTWHLVRLGHQLHAEC